MLSDNYLNYLNLAASRWSNYIKFNSSVVSSIKSTYPDWKGIYLNQTINRPVTIAVGSSTKFTANGHNLPAGTAVKFVSDGTLPTGIISGLTYYIISDGLTPNIFKVSTVLNGTSISTSGTQNGSHYMVQPGAVEYNDSTSNVIASCGVYNYFDLRNNKFVSNSFFVYINTRWANTFSQQDWVNVLTHELGHALGIGIFWSSSYSSKPPTNYFLDGSAYTQAQNAYNNICSLVRSQIPLENTGGSGTVSSHWSRTYRPATATGSGGVGYPGFSNELMIGYYSTGFNLILSQLTIKTLVDFGYEEINPGSSEGSPSLASGVGMASVGNLIELDCNNHGIKPKPIKGFYNLI
jgi:hypothetical protein